MSVGWFDPEEPDDDGDYEELLIPQGLPVLYLQDPETEHVQTFIGWGPGIQYFCNWLHGYRNSLLMRSYAHMRMQEGADVPLEVFLKPDQILAAIHSIAEDN